MNTLPLLASLTIVTVTLVPACGTVDRMYKQDTGDVERVPPPPAYAPEPVSAPAIGPSPAADASAAVPQSGNEPAAEAALEPLPDPEPVPTALRTYTVEKGDNYWKIAKKIYGDPMRMQDIQEANPQIDPKKLRIGDEIVLPE